MDLREAGIKCPFCGGVFVIHAGLPPTNGGVTHPEPDRCEKWKGTRPDLFMMEAMASLGAHYIPGEPPS